MIHVYTLCEHGILKRRYINTLLFFLLAFAHNKIDDKPVDNLFRAASPLKSFRILIICVYFKFHLVQYLCIVSIVCCCTHLHLRAAINATF